MNSCNGGTKLSGIFFAAKSQSFRVRSFWWFPLSIFQCFNTHIFRHGSYFGGFKDLSFYKPEQPQRASREASSTKKIARQSCGNFGSCKTWKPHQTRRERHGDSQNATRTNILNQWIGLRENLQESPILNGKIYGFL